MDRWLSRLGSGRDVVRQELAARFLARHLPESPRRLDVLDAGCGQGTQGLRLALAGHDVTGLDVDGRMLAAFEADLATYEPAVRERVRLVTGAIDEVPRLLPVGSYDVVICHGVLMYVPEPGPPLAALAAMLRPGGVLSVLARNQPGIALRAGHRGRWAEALAALGGNSAYVNELGVAARADTVQGLSTLLESLSLELLDWQGVRVLSDTASLDVRPPGADLADLLAAEELAGRTDPYRAVAPLIRLVARRPPRPTVGAPT